MEDSEQEFNEMWRPPASERLLSVGLLLYITWYAVWPMLKVTLGV